MAPSASPFSSNLAENNTAPGMKPTPILPAMTPVSRPIVQSTIGYYILKTNALNNAAIIPHTTSLPIKPLPSALPPINNFIKMLKMWASLSVSSSAESSDLPFLFFFSLVAAEKAEGYFPIFLIVISHLHQSIHSTITLTFKTMSLTSTLNL